MDPGEVIVTVVFLVSVAFSVSAISRAWIARKRSGSAYDRVGDDRLARLEQAVDAIALEVERISEGQRFTTKLLSEQGRAAPQPVRERLSSNTPI